MSTEEATSPLAREGVLSGALCRAKYEIRNRASVHPVPYLALARRRYRNNPGKVIDRSRTQIVIDGFQRSANTFAVTAFQYAQPIQVDVAHHLHAAAQIRAAVDWGIPAVVLIREPESSILSHMIRFPCVSASQAIGNWARFYESVRDVRSGVVIADFRRVTTDFGSVILETNDRFGTSFVEFDHTPEHERACFELIDRRNEGRFGLVEDHTVARPSAARDAMKDARRAAFDDASLTALRARVRRVYDDLVPDPRG